MTTQSQSRNSWKACWGSMDGSFKRAEDAKHFKVIEGDDNDFFEGCSCDDEDCDQYQKNHFDIPLENLKLSPLTLNDLAEATKTIAPSATAQDVEITYNYFHKHRKLPRANNQIIGDNVSVPRPPFHGLALAEWILGFLVAGIIVFVLVLFYKMSM